MMFLKDKLQLYQFSATKIDSILRIGREWKKQGQGRPAHSSHLHRWNKAEIEIEKKRVWCLQSQVVACELRLDAKDAEIAEKNAHLQRLNRLLQRKQLCLTQVESRSGASLAAQSATRILTPSYHRACHDISMSLFTSMCSGRFASHGYRQYTMRTRWTLARI